MEMQPIGTGRPNKYTPTEMWSEFQEYVKWCCEHPITMTTRTTYSSGNSSEVDESKPRLVSIDGFMIWLGVSDVWWYDIEKSKRYGPEFSRVKTRIKKITEQYQKEMAASGYFNANIIARLLGLADRQTVTEEVVYTMKDPNE